MTQKTIDVGELVEQLELLAAWLKPGAHVPAEAMPPKYQTVMGAITATRQLAAVRDLMDNPGNRQMGEVILSISEIVGGP